MNIWNLKNRNICKKIFSRVPYSIVIALLSFYTSLSFQFLYRMADLGFEPDIFKSGHFEDFVRIIIYIFSFYINIFYIFIYLFTGFKYIYFLISIFVINSTSFTYYFYNSLFSNDNTPSYDGLIASSLLLIIWARLFLRSGRMHNSEGN